jgi:hypothetical protein
MKDQHRIMFTVIAVGITLALGGWLLERSPPPVAAVSGVEMQQYGDELDVLRQHSEAALNHRNFWTGEQQ